MPEKHILIVCGEPSGDLNAASLIQKITEISPSIKISAVGGKHLAQTKAHIFYDIANISVIGLFDVLKNLSKFFTLQKIILQKIKNEKISLVILVDFSGFNLRLAKAINKAIPIIYYISPQVWASRPGRLATIKKFISKIIVLFKFEKEFYARHEINADFVGHPLLDTVKPSMKKEEFLTQYDISKNKLTIALLPGSRESEVKNILPIMLKTALIINQKINDAQFIIAKSPNLNIVTYERIISKTPRIKLKIIEGKTYDCLNIADFCLVASGTATLETALIQKPFAIIYKMGLLNYLLYRPLVKIPYIGMVNIIADKKIIPEFIQFQAKPKKIADHILDIINDKTKAEKIKQGLIEVREILGEHGASQRAAEIIVDFMNNSCETIKK